MKNEKRSRFTALFGNSVATVWLPLVGQRMLHPFIHDNW